MGTHQSATPAPSNGASTASNLTSRVAEQAERAIDASQRATDKAAQALHSGLDTLRDEAPFLLSKAGAGADALLLEGTERAREASAAIRSGSQRMQQQAAAYVRAKPVTSLLLVAGASALITLLLRGPSRSR